MKTKRGTEEYGRIDHPYAQRSKPARVMRSRRLSPIERRGFIVVKAVH